MLLEGRNLLDLLPCLLSVFLYGNDWKKGKEVP